MLAGQTLRQINLILRNALRVCFPKFVQLIRLLGLGEMLMAKKYTSKPLILNIIFWLNDLPELPGPPLD